MGIEACAWQRNSRFEGLVRFHQLFAPHCGKKGPPGTPSGEFRRRTATWSERLTVDQEVASSNAIDAARPVGPTERHEALNLETGVQLPDGSPHRAWSWEAGRPVKPVQHAGGVRFLGSVPQCSKRTAKCRLSGTPCHRGVTELNISGFEPEDGGSTPSGGTKPDLPE